MLLTPQYVAAVLSNRMVQVWRLPGGEPAGAPWPVDEAVVSLHFSPDTRRLAVVTRTNVLVRGPQAEGPTARIAARAGPPLVEFSPDGLRLAVLEPGRSLSIYNSYTGQRLGARLDNRRSCRARVSRRTATGWWCGIEGRGSVCFTGL